MQRFLWIASVALMGWLALGFTSAPRTTETDYRKDIEFALDELEKRCGHFFKVKDIDWKKVRKEFRKAAKKVRSDEEHFALLVRLIARLEDGHAYVKPGAQNAGFEPPEGMFPQLFGPGFTLTRQGKDYFIRTAKGDAVELGIRPGMQVVKIDGTKAPKWVQERIETLSQTRSFSTDHQAEFYALSKGLAHPQGTRLKLELKDHKGKGMKRTVPCSVKGYAPEGPAAFPGPLQGDADLRYLVTEEGFGYIHIRRCKRDLPALMDAALAELGAVPGLLIDFRGNPGGGFDHDGLLGRFVPTGKTLNEGGKSIPSAGPQPYGGPVVVLVDGTVCSAAETGSGMFKEEGRAYLLGESPTAGMSSSKETIALPSGQFELYVSVFSNKARYQGGRGIEGIGMQPHETVALDPEDLAQGKDTLIETGWERLRDFPKNKVPYRPERYGWEKE